MHTRVLVAIMVAGLFVSSTTRSQETEEAAAVNSVSTQDAIKHVGETATVCGKAVQTRYLPDSKNKFTFINLDESFPDGAFCIVIEDADRANFSEPPEKMYRDKSICVTGLIEEFKSKAQIKVKNPSQITVKETVDAPAAPAAEEETTEAPAKE